MSLSFPREVGGLRIMPTTLQAHPHGHKTYLRNIAKRRALSNLWLYILHGQAKAWGPTRPLTARDPRQTGGVFHLWGHSWELEQTAQWTRLEDVLRLLGEQPREIRRVTNGELSTISPP